uniref:Uncharacterized protein n=1 Tax=Zooxanthella nutricula TaxID=1333877 RepID=A0A7S2KHP1_9DINO
MDFGTDDQAALGAALFRHSDGAAPRAAGDIVHVGDAAVRVLAPRCMNPHPSSWSPWSRWRRGDFVMHTWGSHKVSRTLTQCFASSPSEGHAHALMNSSWYWGAAFGASGAFAALAFFYGLKLLAHRVQHAQQWKMRRTPSGV